MRIVNYTILCCLTSIILMSDTFAASSKTDISTWESGKNMQQGNIDQGNLIPDALSIVDYVCALSTEDKAYATQQVQDTLGEIGLTLTKTSAKQYYLMYQQWHTSADTYSQMRNYCIYKTAAYQLQYRFYQVQQGSAAATNPIRTSYARRIAYFDTLTKLNHYDIPTSIQPYLKISVANRTEVLSFHPITKKVAVQMTTLYRGIIAQALNNLLKDKIITQSDVEQIGSHIQFNYVTQCTDLRGLTKVVISKRNDKVIGTSLQSITFNVNVCEDPSYLTNFDQHIKDLVYHELAHYIYYIKDTTRSNYEAICWKSGKKSCPNAEFVTDYSSTASEEDYAEHFQYWYQNKLALPTGVIADKMNYFTNMYAARKE